MWYQPLAGKYSTVESPFDSDRLRVPAFRNVIRRKARSSPDAVGRATATAARVLFTTLYTIPWMLVVVSYVPAEHDVDLAAVAQLSAGAGDGEAAERGAAEVEVRAAPRADAAGALVRDDDRDGAARADAAVEAPDLVAGAAALAGLEQHGAHRAHARLHRHHVHQRPVPARAACRGVRFVHTATHFH